MADLAPVPGGRREGFSHSRVAAGWSRLSGLAGVPSFRGPAGRGEPFPLAS